MTTTTSINTRKTYTTLFVGPSYRGVFRGTPRQTQAEYWRLKRHTHIEMARQCDAR